MNVLQEAVRDQLRRELTQLREEERRKVRGQIASSKCYFMIIILLGRRGTY